MDNVMVETYRQDARKDFIFKNVETINSNGESLKENN